jgi:hypothetical protein
MATIVLAYYGAVLNTGVKCFIIQGINDEEKNDNNVTCAETLDGDRNAQIKIIAKTKDIFFPSFNSLQV